MRTPGRVDARTYRRRLAVSGAFLLPFLVFIFAWHARDALGKGESIWPVILGAGVAMAVLGGTVFHLTREGPENVGARSSGLLKWAVPLAIGIAAVRAIAWLAGWQ
jgi:hypothetical protein